MHGAIRKHIENVRSKDGRAQNGAFLALMKASNRRVRGVHEAWGETEPDATSRS